MVAAIRKQSLERRDAKIPSLKVSSGMSSRQVAAKLGLSHYTVLRVVREHAHTFPADIPAWVPDHMHDGYRREVVIKGEEGAARWARLMKAGERGQTFGPVEGEVA